MTGPATASSSKDVGTVPDPISRDAAPDTLSAQVAPRSQNECCHYVLLGRIMMMGHVPYMQLIAQAYTGKPDCAEVAWQIVEATCSAAVNSVARYMSEVVACFMEQNPPQPVHIGDQRRLAAQARAKAKGNAKAKIAPKTLQQFRIKVHKRNGESMPTIFDGEKKKQILQLAPKTCPDAMDRVRAWVDDLNRGAKTIDEVVNESIAVKRGR